MSFWRSWFVSRRISLAVHCSGGAESQHRHETYMKLSSNSTHASVRSDAGAPSLGTVWMKSLIDGTSLYAGSSRRPSIRSGSVMRTARTTVWPASRTTTSGGTGRRTSTAGAFCAAAFLRWGKPFSGKRRTGTRHAHTDIRRVIRPFGKRVRGRSNYSARAARHECAGQFKAGKAGQAGKAGGRAGKATRNGKQAGSYRARLAWLACRASPRSLTPRLTVRQALNDESSSFCFEQAPS